MAFHGRIADGDGSVVLAGLVQTGRVCSTLVGGVGELHRDGIHLGNGPADGVLPDLRFQFLAPPGVEYFAVV